MRAGVLRGGRGGNPLLLPRHSTTTVLRTGNSSNRCFTILTLYFFSRVLFIRNFNLFSLRFKDDKYLPRLGHGRVGRGEGVVEVARVIPLQGSGSS